MLFACAEVAPPPGGPEDRNGPFMVGSYPENGSTNVPRGREITIKFSERIKKPERGKSVYISPRPQEDPELKWGSDKLTIKFTDSFAVDQTYIVSLASTISDYRANKMDSSLILAFTTGDSIDTGQMGGRILQDGRPASGLLVGLFDPDRLDQKKGYDSTHPVYLTQTNQLAEFSFAYLPHKSYRLIAFRDENNNEYFNPSKEIFALPDREVLIGGEERIDKLEMRTTRLDTLKPEIISIAYTQNHLLRMRLSHPIDISTLKSVSSNIALHSVTDSNLIYYSRGLRERDTTEAAELHIAFDSIPEGEYYSHVIYDADDLFFESDTFEVKITEDIEPPEIMTYSPGAQPIFVDEAMFSLLFSEPIDQSKLTVETFGILDPNNQAVPFERETVSPFRFRFKPNEVKEGWSYRLAMAEFEIADLAGNLLGDSLREYTLSVLDQDSLGSVSGIIRIALVDRKLDPVMFRFNRIESQQAFERKVTAREFDIDLPAGKYLLEGFIDSNLNGRMDNGSLFPYTPAETFASYPDTIIVRARFETAGVEFLIQ